jgi:PAS domain S-box-containing protein
MGALKTENRWIKAKARPDYEMAFDGLPRRAVYSFRQKLVGPLLVTITAATIELLKNLNLYVPSPPAVLITLIIFAAFKGGLSSGFISGAVAWLYLVYLLSEPGRFFQFNDENFARAAIWGVTIPFIVWMISTLKNRLIDRGFVEKRLRDSENRINLFLNGVQEYAIFMLDPSGNIINWNEGAQRITGYSTGEIIGEHFSCLSLAKDRTSGRVENMLEKALKEGRFEDEGWRIRKDGSRFWANVVITPVRDQNGRLTGYTDITRDITERKFHLEELKKAKDVAEKARFSAEEANRAKTNFLANMSHEIRTPLGVILGYAELLNNPSQTRSDRQHTINIIKRNGEMLSRIINDILDLSKIETSSVDVDSEKFSLPVLLSDIRSMFAIDAREKGIRLNFEIDGMVPETIKSDPTRLRQILMNIVGNAVKFTDHGSVTVTVSLVYSGNAHQLQFIVADCGPGMTLDQMSRLFRPFEQADNSPTRKYGGTGLGLALSRRLAKALGGDLMIIRSNPGVGSVFSLLIDPGQIEDIKMIDHLDLDLTENNQAAHDVHTHHEPTGKRLEGIHVLVVEDIPDNQILISRFLKMDGATVDLAKNGREALAKLTANRSFDVVLMDIQMPELDGYQTTQKLRESHYDGPIIALTAHAMKEERERCLMVGCDDHLTKPINRDMLIDRVAWFAGKRHSFKKQNEPRHQVLH